MTIKKPTLISSLHTKARRTAAVATIVAATMGVFTAPPTAMAQVPGDSALRSVAQIPETPFDAPPGTWTLAVLPDTQFYAKWYPEIFRRQTEWLVRHKEHHNIRFVVHLGDITNNNGHYEWQVAKRAMNILNAGKVPYSVLPGNHDIGTRGSADTRATLMNRYFSEADYANNAAYGLFEPGKMENSWHEFDTPTGKYLVLALEFYPRNEVLAWANEIVSKAPDRKVILTTHAYLRRAQDDSALSDGVNGPVKTRYELTGSSANDGKDIWEKLVSRHPNFIMTLNGHVAGRGHRIGEGANGQTVHQMLSDYQDSPQDPTGSASYNNLRPGYGGGGFLRLLQFAPDGKTVRVRSYSPWYDHWFTESQDDFEIKW